MFVMFMFVMLCFGMFMCCCIYVLLCQCLLCFCFVVFQFCHAYVMFLFMFVCFCSVMVFRWQVNEYIVNLKANILEKYRHYIGWGADAHIILDS